MAEWIPGLRSEWWESYAACRSTPVATFFVEQRAAKEQAKAVCSTCPVCAECRAFGIAAGPALFGTWGGLSRRERAKLRRSERRMDGAA